MAGATQEITGTQATDEADVRPASDLDPAGPIDPDDDRAMAAGTAASMPSFSPPRPRTVVGPFTGRHLLALGATIVAVGALLALLNLPIAGTTPSLAPAPGSSFFVISQATTGLQVGQQAPELTAQGDAGGNGGQGGAGQVGLADLDGRPIRLADLRGHPVWITFWATWCPPCQQEMPVLRDEFAAHRAQGLALLAISVQETTADDVRAYARTYGLDFTIGFDATSAIFKAYQGYGLPTHLFLDRNGVIRTIHLGPLTRDEAEQILAPLLAD